MLIVIGMIVSAMFGLSIGILMCESVDKTEIANTKEFKYLADQVYSCKNRLESIEMKNDLENQRIIGLLAEIWEVENEKIRTL